MVERQRLGEILVGLQVLTPAEVERVLDAMRRRRDQRKFGQVAGDMGLLREEHVLAALAVQMELFPGLANLSLPRLLDRLQASSGADMPARGTREARLTGGRPSSKVKTTDR
jgi:hypothetical protein